MRTLYNKTLAAFPQYHYGQLMRRGWRVFMPVSMLFVLLGSFYLMATESFV